MANFEAFRWKFLLSTNSEIGRSVLGTIPFGVSSQNIYQLFISLWREKKGSRLGSAFSNPIY